MSAAQAQFDFTASRPASSDGTDKADVVAKLAERFRAQNGECGLEVSWKAKRQQYLDEHYLDSTKRDVIKQTKDASAARHRGWMAGKDIEIRPAVKAGVTVQRGALTGGSERKLLTGGAIERTTET